MIRYNGNIKRKTEGEEKKSVLKKAMCLLLSVGCLFQTACVDKGADFIESTVETLRDPCVLVVGKTYYMYGSGWVCYKNTSKDLAGEWAPEVHAYKGAYYMFTTYRSKTTQLRGCTVLRSESPEGPFREISNGQINKHLGYHTIDGTLYVDEDGQPWMVFVREWIGSPDQIGGMMAAKLSMDLSEMISEPIELFRANEPLWEVASITDGCWLYRCKNGELLMLWSNFNAAGYCVAIARSENGKMDGEWTHDRELLYSKRGREFDGGHGMIFTALNGSKYLALHAPNSPVGERKEKPIFIKIQEKNGNLYLLG